MATSDYRAGKLSKATNPCCKPGEAIPVPHDGGPVKQYQHPVLPGNGPVPSNPYKGIVTRSKQLPGPPDNLA